MSLGQDKKQKKEKRKEKLEINCTSSKATHCGGDIFHRVEDKEKRKTKYKGNE